MKIIEFVIMDHDDCGGDVANDNVDDAEDDEHAAAYNAPT